MTEYLRHVKLRILLIKLRLLVMVSKKGILFIILCKVFRVMSMLSKHQFELEVLQFSSLSFFIYWSLKEINMVGGVNSSTGFDNKALVMQMGNLHMAGHLKSPMATDGVLGLVTLVLGVICEAPLVVGAI